MPRIHTIKRFHINPEPTAALVKAFKKANKALEKFQERMSKMDPVKLEARRESLKETLRRVREGADQRTLMFKIDYRVPHAKPGKFKSECMDDGSVHCSFLNVAKKNKRKRVLIRNTMNNIIRSLPKGAAVTYKIGK